MSRQPSTVVLLSLVPAVLVGCASEERAPKSAAPQPPPEPRRTAAEATDVRRMLAEVTAARACDQLRGMFRPVGGNGEGEGEGEGKTPANGVVWIEECAASEKDMTVTLELAGRGWIWVSRETEKAGATFSVDEYVPYRFSLDVRGKVDVAYATGAKVFTAWFTPEREPKASFQPIGEVDVDTEGVWSSVVSGLASAFTTSPSARAEEKIGKVGEQRFEQMFARGLAVTVDLCSGHVRTGLGHPEAGEMLGDPPVVERASAELHRDGLFMRGPLKLPEGGMNIRVTGEGAVAAKLVCQDDAAAIARAFVEGSPLPNVDALASVEVRDRAVLTVPKPGRCPIVQVLQPLAIGDAPVEVSYEISPLAANLPKLATCERGNDDKKRARSRDQSG